ncbi:hypothetical protein VQH23_03935 [Pararoseomonas sp. SCSIO 73927]|uniref:hypothetical protein n=1 Tax=Pararoseomonas sp. SCSIO 73927 TaxID=3114537 RepID=UPI0030CFB822
MDLEGSWGWSGTSAEYLFREVIPHLHNLETMSWQQLRAQGSHPIPTDQVCKEARERLGEIGKADEDSLYSVRFTGRCRVWGIRRGVVFHLLWWDPQHSVYPVAKKNT